MSDYEAFWQKNPFRNLWQHPLWADFQNAANRKTWLLETKGASALVVKHKLPKGFNWLEVPRGPLWTTEKGLKEIMEKIEKIGQREKSIFIRFSPYRKIRNVKCEMRNAEGDHHPEASLILDLKPDLEDILMQMKPKGRYNVRLAQKHGIQIEQSHDADEFHKLLKKTGNRDGFGIHPKAYYQNMLDALGVEAQLLLAVHEERVIAGGIFTYLDDWGIYYYGASDHHYRNLMAPYLIQFEAIKEAKDRECKFYDFLGISPNDNKHHPWSGVTNFKKKFGGRAVHYPKAKEIVLRPFWNFVLRLYKKFR